MSNLFKAKGNGTFGLVVRSICVAALCAITLLATGCGTSPYTAKELILVLKKAGGWTPLPIPDSKFRPGSIIEVTEDGLRWIDDLTSCGYPLAEFEEKSYIPSVTFTKQVEFAASAVINIKGISAGPQFSRASKVRMEIADNGADAIRLIKLKIWMEDPDNQKRVSPVCMAELMKPNTYLITEAFRISKGKYTFYDKTGAAIKVETPILKDLLQFQPDVKYEITNDGSLIIEQTAYFAVRKAQRMGDGFATLKSTTGEPDIADAIIERLFLKASEKK